MMRYFTFTLGLLIALCTQAQDWQSLHIKGRFDTIEERFMGETWQKVDQLQGLDTLWLHAVRIEIEDLRLNGQKVNYWQNDTALFIPLAELDSAQIYIKYEAQPRKGLYFIGWQDSTRRSRRQIWTQGQGIDHRHWIPHRDDQRDKILFSAEWIFDSSYVVMGNGTIDSLRYSDGQTHWHYSLPAPMSSYLIALAVDHYAVSLQRVGEERHLLYHYPERKADARWYYYRHDAIARFLKAEIDYPYPWPNYRQAPVQDFRHGAMENTCATIFGDFFLVDSIAFNDRNYTYVDAHEFAHQWFGNLVTAASSKHHWLHEGFATYYQWLSEGNLYGPDHLAWELEQARTMVRSASLAGPLPLAHPQAGSARFYQKGGWLLYMLRDFVGDSIYRVVIPEYLEKHAFGIVRNRDLIEAFKKHSNQDIDGFFQAWLYADREPLLKIERSEDRLQIHLTGDLPQSLLLVQEQDGNRFQRKLQLKKGKNEIELLDAEARYYFANYRDLLVEVEEIKPASDWIFQFEAAESLLARAFALDNLIGISSPGILAWSRGIAEDQKLFYALRLKAAAVYCSQAIEDGRRQDFIEGLIRQAPVKLQLGLLRLSVDYDLNLSAELLQKLRRGASYDLRKLALERSIDPREAQANRWLYDSIYQEEPGIVGKQVYLESLLFRVYLFEDREAYKQLLDHASGAFDFNTRIYALEFLALLPHPNQVYLDRLWEAFFNSNWKLVRVAKQGLEKSREMAPEKWQEDYQNRKPSWTDFQKRKAARTFEK